MFFVRVWVEYWGLGPITLLIIRYMVLNDNVSYEFSLWVLARTLCYVSSLHFLLLYIYTVHL